MSTQVSPREVAPEQVPPIVDPPRSELELRVARLARAVLVALAVAVIVASISGAGLGSADGSSTSDGRLGGDFPAFYAAGSIVYAGDVDELYDPARQEFEQLELGIDGYLAFAYPPHVAAAYAPLAALDFQAAYLVHTVFMALCFVGALMVLSRHVRLLVRWRWPLLAAGFTFYPLFTAVGGGQNAPLTMLLLALVWRGVQDDRPALMGIAAGLLLYRPQYALPVIGLLLLSRQGRAVAWATLVGALTWATTALLLGVGWVTTWFDQVIPFVERDAEVNAPNSISILGFLQAAWGADVTAAVAVGAVLAAGVVLVLMWLWANPSRFSIDSRMGALAIGVTLISPHTMFYDASLVVLAGIALLAAADRAPEAVAHQVAIGRTKVIALVWAAALLHVVSDGFGATPLALVVVACFVAFVIQAVHETASRSEVEPVHA